ncbi:hypothetical protein [Paenibacillus sp. QZ-Y1]|uniref:hypothetical protein n=1 Tax=Paenibacillus sp. QZ-Y1 TaxID=3414511 RepID=UPI003F792243
MNPEDHIQHMLQAIIEQTQSIINDTGKQSFGSLEYFLEHIVEYRDEQQYMSNEWHIRTPRWLGNMEIRLRKKSSVQTFTDCNCILLNN